MIFRIRSVLPPAELQFFRSTLKEASWIDGNATSGSQSALAKKNQQLDTESPTAIKLGDMILNALARHAHFFSAALPHKIFPPLFNRYTVEQHFHNHIDNAIRILKGSDFRIRCDLSATLFLNDPHEYEGGELCIHDTFGTHQVKLTAGDMILYPSSSLHQVQTVTKGARLASFFWIQSMVKENDARNQLYELDQQIQSLTKTLGEQDERIIRLTGLYHNLLRRWTEI